IMESLFAVVDMFWVSSLGKEAVAVVGLTESVMTLIYAVAMGLSFAGTALVARRIGEKNAELAAHSAGQVILLGAAVSIALGVTLAIFAGTILRLMGADEHVVTIGTTFTRIVLGCNITVFLIFLINAIFRGAGDAVLAMRTLWLANALNIVLGPCFIFGWGPFPELGLVGAAVATNIGRGTGVLYQLWHLAGFHSRVKVRLRHLQPALADMKVIVTTASSGIAQMLISTTSWIGLFKILAVFGSAAIAGYTIAIRLVVFALLPAWGLSNAGATLVGQNLGANKPDRAEQAVKIATCFNVIFLGIVGVVFVIFARLLVRVFTTDVDVLPLGSSALWIVSLGFPVYAAGMCLSAAFNGAGDTWTPTKINFFCFWILQVPIAWILANKFAFGARGVFIAVPIAFTAMAVWSAILFKRGEWKMKKI
ncbi:MAG TPA: MATE family efflux transporter, partial [Steroidobacteraceae bacterium]|nr:MATE family efflux transporter [Steroidobacteraceae bacterium]